MSWRREGDAVDIADWLRGLGLEKYAPAFDEEAALADAEAAIAALHQRTAAQLAMLDEALPALAQALPGTDAASCPTTLLLSELVN